MPQSLRERFGALRNLPPFVRLVWQTNPTLTLAQCALRLVRALLPVVTLYVGKLIIDEVVALTQTAGAPQSAASGCSRGCSTDPVVARAGIRASPCSPMSSGEPCRISTRCSASRCRTRRACG
jgi:hypothetical protein